MVEIRVRALILSIYEGPRSDRGYLRRMKIKEIMIIYLRKLIDIGIKIMLQRL